MALTEQQGQSFLGTETQKHTTNAHLRPTFLQDKFCNLHHFPRLFFLFFFIWHIPHQQKHQIFLQLGYNAWAVAYILYVSTALLLLHNISKTPNGIKHMKTLTLITLFWRMLASLQKLQSWTKRYWLTFLTVTHNEKLSYSISTWINAVALVLLILCFLQLSAGVWPPLEFKRICQISSV